MKPTQVRTPIGEIHYFGAGFFDLLGQSEGLESIRALLARGIPVRTAAVRKILTARVREVDTQRGLFEGWFDGLTVSNIGKRRGLRNRDLNLRWNSDSVVMWQSLTGLDGKADLRVLADLMQGSAVASLGLLSRNLPMRGGIEVDFADEFWKKPREIYGPALLSAYRLEGRTAGWPRVALGANALLLLFHYKPPNPSVTT